MSTGVLHKFYCSKAWLSFRQMIIQDRSKEGVKCEICGRLILRQDEIHIHHTPIELTEQNYIDRQISLNPDNVKMVCKECHDKEHNRFCKGAKRNKEYSRHIVCGPPCSGKTTYVKRHMSTGDIVVDMDTLFKSMSGLELYNKPDNLKFNVLAVKNQIIGQIEKHYGNFKGAWIIGAYPNIVEREQLAERLGAEVVLMQTSKEECIARLAKCKDYRVEHRKEWETYIEKWFEKFS